MNIDGSSVINVFHHSRVYFLRVFSVILARVFSVILARSARIPAALKWFGRDAQHGVIGQV